MSVSVFISKITELIYDKFGVTLIAPVNFTLYSISRMFNLKFTLRFTFYCLFTVNMQHL
jgi:hypothetical protein